MPLNDDPRRDFAESRIQGTSQMRVTTLVSHDVQCSASKKLTWVFDCHMFADVS